MQLTRIFWILWCLGHAAWSLEVEEKRGEKTCRKCEKVRNDLDSIVKWDRVKTLLGFFF